MNEINDNTFYSWTVVDKSTMIKKGDKSFFEYKSSGIPKEVKWFFSADKMETGDKKDISFIYLNEVFPGKLEIAAQNRCRISWHQDLSDCFFSYYHEEADVFPLIRFSKITDTKYEIEFIDDLIVENEKEEPYESVVSQKEGKRKEFFTTKYERNPYNRKKAIEIHGVKCMICGFDFEEMYGDAGRNFIEVHHIKPLSELNAEVTINPETDLVCLCANCHRIIHRNKDRVYTIDEVKRMITRSK